MQIRPGTYWLYVGGEEGFGLVHMIVSLTGLSKTSRVMTYSIYDQGGEDEPGFIWDGTLNRFLDMFEPLGPPDESMV